MRCRMSAKLVEVVRLNGSRAGCHDRFSSRRPVGGEVFYLDSPFIEPTFRPLTTTALDATEKSTGVAEADGCRTGRGRRHLSGIPIYEKRMSRETLPRRETTLNVAGFVLETLPRGGCERSPQTERSERQRHAKPKHTPP